MPCSEGKGQTSITFKLRASFAGPFLHLTLSKVATYTNKGTASDPSIHTSISSIPSGPPLPNILQSLPSILADNHELVTWSKPAQQSLLLWRSKTNATNTSGTTKQSQWLDSSTAWLSATRPIASTVTEAMMMPSNDTRTHECHVQVVGYSREVVRQASKSKAETPVDGVDPLLASSTRYYRISIRIGHVNVAIMI